MARVKSVVPETVREGGFAILNAEDDLVYKMKDELECNVALFSMDENNPRIKKHCKAGGYAADHFCCCKHLYPFNSIIIERSNLPVPR